MAANDDRDASRRRAGGARKDTGKRPGRSSGRDGAGKRAGGAKGRDRGRQDRSGAAGRGRQDRAPAADRRAAQPREGRRPEPGIPEDVDATALDRSVRDALRTLPKELAERVGAHLAAASHLADTDPAAAYEHAAAARHRAPRLAVTRETCGVAAYRTGRWAEAAQELRAARRMSGNDELLPVIADCARGLGDPQRALDIASSPECVALRGAPRAEALIVASGARRDLGQLDAAVVLLQVPDLGQQGREPWRARLQYAYADALAAAGRTSEACEWFARVAAMGGAIGTDAAERLAELGSDDGQAGTAGNPGGEAIVDLTEQ